MTALEKSYPAYLGNEPYLHLCFSEKSSKKVLALLRRLRLRGVRVWYGAEASSDRSIREAMHERMVGAALTVIYLDEAFRSDPIAKSKLLACQREKHRMICLNTDGGDGGLSIGLHADACEVKLNRGASAEEAERALLHADGFSQELIGTPEKPERKRVRILTIIVIIAAAALLTAGALYFLQHRNVTPPEEPTVPTDTVTIEDERIREAISNSLGGGLLTEENLQTVTVLRLEGDTLPDDLSALKLLPALETIELSQPAAGKASAYPELSGYTIELYGGASE